MIKKLLRFASFFYHSQVELCRKIGLFTSTFLVEIFQKVTWQCVSQNKAFSYSKVILWFHCILKFDTTHVPTEIALWWKIVPSQREWKQWMDIEYCFQTRIHTHFQLCFAVNHPLFWITLEFWKKLIPFHWVIINLINRPKNLVEFW